MNVNVMVEYTNTENALRVLMDAFIDELRTNLINMDKVATGALANNLGYSMGRTGDGWKIFITAEPYLSVVDGGRRPGKFPPPGPISDWIQIKGLNFGTLKGMTFVISRAISEHGIQPTNVIELSWQGAFDALAEICSRS